MLRFIVPIATVGAALALQTALEPVLGGRRPFAMYFVAVLIAAWASGRGAGLLAVGLSVVAAVEANLPGSFNEWVDAVLYVAVGTTIAQLMGSMHAARERVDQELAARRDVEQELRLGLARRDAVELALRVSEERFRLAADAMNGIIYDQDSASGLVLRTRGLFDVVGYTPQEAEPTQAWWHERIHPEDLQRASEEARAASEAADRYSVEYRVRHRDGQWIWVRDCGLTVRDSDGGIVRVVGSSIDVTAHRDAEAALRETDERKDRFLATLAHELRNPLGPIRNAAEIVRRQAPQDAHIVRACELLDRQVSHMARLVDDLLDLSRMTRGHVQLQREFVALTDILQQALDQTQPLIDAKQQHLTVQTEPDAIVLHADPVRLVQVIANLVANASKYTEAHGHITVAAQRDGSNAVIRVRDSGVGIAPELLPRVFDMFVQGKTAAARVQGGLGIGLTLVRELVVQHGGAVQVHSAGVGQGAEFTVTLPAVPLEFSVAAQPARAGENAPPAIRALRILVVEDNADAAETLALLLELAGHEVRVAADGVAGVDLAQRFIPDVAFVDIGLPGIDGYEVARRLRALPSLAGVTLIALTGYGQEADEAAAIAAGFDHHVTKPVELDRIGALLALHRGKVYTPPVQHAGSTP